MTSVYEFVAEILFFVFILSIYWYSKIPKNLPPGPVGLPFLGCALQFLDGRKQHLILQKHVKKYGPISKIYIGSQLVVVLGNYDAIYEAIVKQGDVFLGRPRYHICIPEKLHGYGVVLSEGDLWREQRRFTVSTLRDFGVGRPVMEPRIKEETEYLIAHFQQYAETEQAFDPHRSIICAVANVIHQMLFGHRLKYDDQLTKQFFMLCRHSSRSGVSFLSPYVVSGTFASMLRFLPIVKKFVKETSEFADYIENQIKQTASTYDPDSEQDNFVHAFMKAASNEKGQSYFSDIQLLSTCLDLFVAGTETASTTMRWALFYLTLYPDVQEKLYEEIKEEVGTSELPRFADRTKLHFTEAVIMEVHRLADILPLGLARRPTGPAKLLGYDIPENAMVLPLLTNIFHNPEYYPEPLRFDPYRFLDENGHVIRDPKLIPFQAGKRICLGEPLAKMELFFFVIGIFSRFRVSFTSEKPLPTTEPLVGFTSSPVPYKICLKSRDE